MVFHSLVLLQKIVQNKTPAYLYNKVMSESQSEKPKTNQSEAAILEAAGNPRQPTVEDCELGLKKKSWCWSSVVWYNKLPLDLGLEDKLGRFKTTLKEWVKGNVSKLTLEL